LAHDAGTTRNSSPREQSPRRLAAPPPQVTHVHRSALSRHGPQLRSPPPRRGGRAMRAGPMRMSDAAVLGTPRRWECCNHCPCRRRATTLGWALWGESVLPQSFT
jgi:hypothetical protein